MQKTKRQLLARIGLALLGITPMQGQSSDALLDKLVEKGILTVDEARELRKEAEEGFDSAYEVKTGLPDWVTSLRIGGDFRGRYEMFHSDHPDFADRHRFRYRVRPKIVATLRDNFEVGFGLTSGEDEGSFGGDPISGNTTFRDNGSKKFIFVHLAYAQWTPVKNSVWSSTLTMGKMENPFVFSGMVFDSDYTPEGFAQQFAFQVADAHTIGVNLGQFVLDEIGASSSDPFLLGAQLRLDSEWNDQISTTFGLGGLMITAEERLNEPAGGSPAVPDINTGNSREAGVLTEEYTPIIADAAFTYKLEDFPGYAGAFPIRLGAEYLRNPGAEDQNEGYAIGVTFGKAGKQGLWELSYHWRSLEADAWYEELVDSNNGALFPGASYRAGTNVEGHIFKGGYSPYDSLTLGVTYTLTERITGVTAELDEAMGRLQVDAVWKF